jgi:hypothetical protein
VRYMMLIYQEESDPAKAPQEEVYMISEGHRAVMNDTAKRGIFRGGDKLKSTATATTVRIQADKPMITDGPFAETKEVLAGYYILDCHDLDEAIGWAARIAGACKGGSGVEIRPIETIPQPTVGGSA